MFGISFPRFAIRVYLDEEYLSFINARRLFYMRSMAPTEWDIPEAVDFEATGLDHCTEEEAKRPSAFLRFSSCLADGLLATPKRHSGYQVIKVELGIAYGEPQEIKGTPYVQGLNFSVLCAQSVCFMANAMMVEHCNNLYGIAEISDLSEEGIPVFDDRKLSEEAREVRKSSLVLGGMDLMDMVRFFQSPKVGLNATIQLQPTDETVGTMDLALRSYLRSGMPVILPVDMDRMAGFSQHPEKAPIAGEAIYPANGVTDLREPVDSQSGAHAVIAVGSMKKPDEEWCYLFNDPSMMPFMEATSAQFENAANYDRQFELMRPTVLPVTP
ncbi:MAG: hypothetical protein AAF585_05865, partial [Verrucomicrobiota bacterium]